MNLTRINKGTKLILISSIIILLGGLIFFLLKKQETTESSIISQHDLINHPLYSQYDFKLNDSVINIGIQPMYLPTGIIFEVIKRDNILNKTLAASGKKLEYYSFLKGADVNYFLQNNMLAGGVGGDMPALSISRVFDVIIPIIIQKGNVSMVSGEPMLTEDLAGKRIAYPYGSIAHHFVLDMLQSAGTPEEDVHLLPMEVSLMAEALHEKKIDLFSTWEPNVFAALKQHPDFFITYKKMTTGYFYLSANYANENTEIANQIVAAIVRSVLWMRKNKNNLRKACEWNITEINKLTGRNSVLTANEFSTLALNDIIGYFTKNSMVVNNDELKEGSPLYKEYNFLNKMSTGIEKQDWEEVKKDFDNKLLINILKHPDKYRLTDYDYNKDIK